NNIHFGTDGWRGVIGDDFTYEAVREVASATAEAFAQEYDRNVNDARLLVGYDMRFQAGAFAEVVAEVLARRGFEVLVSDRPMPTPGLSYCISRDEKAVGGLMLTASHNPAPWLGIKVRMADGGASPAEFTDRIEELMENENGSDPIPPDQIALRKVDLAAQYLDGIRASLKLFAPAEEVEATPIKVVIDPLYGAGQGLLAELMREQGVDVVEIHAQQNPGFDGLHPEPIPPWTDQAAAAVVENNACAAFIVDGDADRVGAIDENGIFVNSHRLFALLTEHLVEDLGRTGRVIKTVALSTTIDRLGSLLGVDVVVKPIGFKWVYEEMLKGDVLIGGEESGGIGISDHVYERDGLLMALLLLQMMRVRGETLGELVADLQEQVGTMYYLRRDLKLDEESAQRFRTELVHSTPTKMAGKEVRSIDRLDGLKLIFDDDEWLLLRGSGTEPLIRIYAEANTPEQMNAYLDAGSALVQGSGEF
ncbi:MAG: phosphoglucomutase/phosphomannomutase family protein, partial [Coriobacteriia bacterium]|nr:phosphoglucomutase/phosphomannomutase family protein [Coriobacteriia bacterium]